MAGYVFISYARDDGSDFAEKLQKALKREGIGTWLDKTNLSPSTRWNEEIDKALDKANAVIVILTPRSVVSQQVEGEWIYALDKKKPIIPFKLLTCEVPRTLRTINYIDCLSEGFDSAFGRLCDILRPITGTSLAISGVPQREVLPSLHSPPNTPLWIPISGGKFLVGDNQLADAPEYTAEISAFYISRAPVTQKQYQRFVRLAGYNLPDSFFVEYAWISESGTPPSSKLDHPVVAISARDAEAYCNWLNEELQSELIDKLQDFRGNWRVRLPSEIEWERVARGDDRRPYAWGKGNPDKRFCNFGGHYGGTTSVSRFDQSSPYGVDDLAGNVWEWTRSVFRSYPYDPNDGREVLASDDLRIIRGGSWEHGADPATLYAAYRAYESPDSTSDTIGFRVVISRVTLPR